MFFSSLNNWFWSMMFQGCALSFNNVSVGKELQLCLCHITTLILLYSHSLFITSTLLTVCLQLWESKTHGCITTVQFYFQCRRILWWIEKNKWSFIIRLFPFAVIGKYLRITVELSLNIDRIFYIHEYDLSV